MAEAPRSLELLYSCQVCFEEFTEDDEHVPRLLPCTHTLCHTCIGQLIKNNKIECPECREKHEAKKEEKSFLQNKYLLTQIKRKSSNEPPATHEFQKCVDHGKELNMFCLDPECNKAICRSCLKKDHKKHEVTEIEDHEKEVLTREVEKIKMNLKAKVEFFSTAKKDISDKTNAVLADLTKTKEEILSHIGKMIEAIRERNRLENMRIDDELSAMNSNVDLLSSIQRNMEREDEMSYEDIMNNRDTVLGISEHNKDNLSGVRVFGYSDFTKEVILGKINIKELTISLPDPEDPYPTKMTDVPPQKITNASQIQCSGMTLVITSY